MTTKNLELLVDKYSSFNDHDEALGHLMDNAKPNTLILSILTDEQFREYYGLYSADSTREMNIGSIKVVALPLSQYLRVHTAKQEHKDLVQSKLA